jgi:hypothetical protein
MDPRLISPSDFALFIKRKLIEKASEYDETLFSVSYKNMEEGKYISGVRSTLLSIADYVTESVKEYYGEK